MAAANRGSAMGSNESEWDSCGLWIARMVAEGHGLRATWSDRSGGGNCMAHSAR
ncbi:sensor histidine kinase [Sesbania bispinosa]|nr:sensor histidine kinase [Sesbania bispinosa]